MLTAVQELILANPTPAVLYTRADVDYSPDQDYDPAAAGERWVYGAFYKVTEESADFDATLLIAAGDVPDDFATAISQIRIISGVYGLKKIRPRWAEGRLTGYSLELGQ